MLTAGDGLLTNGGPQGRYAFRVLDYPLVPDAGANVIPLALALAVLTSSYECTVLPPRVPVTVVALLKGNIFTGLPQSLSLIS